MPTDALHLRFAALADNPVLRRELRQLSRQRVLYITVLLCLAGCAATTVILYQSAAAAPARSHTSMLAEPVDFLNQLVPGLPPALFLLPLIAAVVASTMAVRDNLLAASDLLQLTDLTLGEVVNGRFLATFLPMLLIVVAGIPFVIAQLLVPPSPPLSALLLSLLLLGGFIACGAAFGQFIGNASRSHSGAIVLAVLITSCLLYFLSLLPLITMFFFQLAHINIHLPAQAVAAVMAWVMACWLLAKARRQLDNRFNRTTRNGR